MPDDEDRLRDASSDAGTGSSRDAPADVSWAGAAAPDDISALSKDIAAYHREQRAARRNAALDRYLGRPGAPVLALIVGVLAVACVVAIVMTVMRPNHSNPLIPPTDRPASPSAADGQVNGLVPEATLTAMDDTPQASRALRPRVLAIMTPQCECNGDVVALARHSTEVSSGALLVSAISPSPGSADADALTGRLPAGDQVYDDPSATLATGFRAAGLTAVVVRPDGTIAQVVRSLTASTVGRVDASISAIVQHQTAS